MSDKHLGVREVISTATNNALWCLPDFKGAARVDRNRLEEINRGAEQAIQKLITEARVEELTRLPEGMMNIHRRRRGLEYKDPWLGAIDERIKELKGEQV